MNIQVVKLCDKFHIYDDVEVVKQESLLTSNNILLEFTGRLKNCFAVCI